MKLNLFIAVISAVFFFMGCSSGESKTNDDSKTDDFVKTDDEAVIDNEVQDDAVDPVCGNATVETGEVCDGGEIDCAKLDSAKWGSGKAACKADCSGYDEANCVEIVLCGNETVDTGEECDGTGSLCSELGMGYLTGVAECTADCKFDTSTCLPQCGNGELEEGEECEYKEDEETQDSISCHKLSWLEYKSGDAVCGTDCKWDKTACVALDVVPQYGILTNIGLNEVGTITDSKKLCVPKEGEDGCDFDAQYALGAVVKNPTISGNYGNGKSFLETPSIFTGKTGGKYSLAVNKGFDPLPEKFFTLFASIAYTPITFDNIEMFGPQVVLMFNSETIPNTTPGTEDYYNIGGIGDDDIIIAIGEQFVSSDTIDVDSLCIAAIAFGKKMVVSNAFNVMADGGGGSITFSGFDIPLYHPTETPLGDLTEMVKEYGLENICDK
ncbi:MAG TPA: hypothetical protein PLX56_02845 [bacterium]|jgi:hypothetical protein|nr:hypothetical protein [bacterium]HQI04017.1 hypothetical protein [bacterium]HQN72911.1 hypothetical protein [bacterium]HQO91242.1 hypothetical protein [bacterium]